MERNRIIERIRKLLNLSRSSNPHEAALAAEKVQRMLSEYNLTMESVLEDGKTKADTVHRKTRKDLEKWAYMLAGRTAYAFDCNYYHSLETGETSFVGVGADPEVCGWMYEYLYRTLLRLASEYMRGPARRLRSPKAKREARSSFLVGAVEVISDRMIAQKRATPVTPWSLVPVKDSLIRAAMPDDIRSKPLNTGRLRDDHLCAGRLAGEGVSLSMPLAGNGYLKIA